MEQPIEAGPRRLFGAEGEAPLVEVDGRVQPCVLEVRRAAPLDDGRIHLSFDHLAQDMLLHRVYQARLTDARLAGEKNDLPNPLLGLLPAILEQADLVIAAGQRCKPGRPHRLDGAAGLADDRRTRKSSIELSEVP